MIFNEHCNAVFPACGHDQIGAGKDFRHCIRNANAQSCPLDHLEIEKIISDGCNLIAPKAKHRCEIFNRSGLGDTEVVDLDEARTRTGYLRDSCKLLFKYRKEIIFLVERRKRQNLRYVVKRFLPYVLQP